MKLQDRLSAMKQDSIATKPAEIIGPLLEETKKLIESGVADKAINVGETLPELALTDSAGEIIRSKNLLSKGPLIVTFYRGVW